MLGRAPNAETKYIFLYILRDLACCYHPRDLNASSKQSRTAVHNYLVAGRGVSLTGWEGHTVVARLLTDGGPPGPFGSLCLAYCHIVCLMYCSKLGIYISSHLGSNGVYMYEFVF